MTMLGMTMLDSARVSLRPRLARARAFLVLLAQAFAEARELEHAARKRHPFAEW